MSCRHVTGGFVDCTDLAARMSKPGGKQNRTWTRSRFSRCNTSPDIRSGERSGYGSFANCSQILVPAPKSSFRVAKSPASAEACTAIQTAPIPFDFLTALSFPRKTANRIFCFTHSADMMRKRHSQRQNTSAHRNCFDRRSFSLLVLFNEQVRMADAFRTQTQTPFGARW